MWIRLIEVHIDPDKTDEFRKIYNEEIVPVLKAQKGNIDAFLMESQDRPGQLISFTSWKRREDGDVYESSGDYVKNINKVKHTFTEMPTLWSYVVKK
jgi:quinol monooxygenase YgiN